MTYREKEFAAQINGAKSARQLAHRSRLMAEIFPAYREEEMAECKRHFGRAREYLDRARLVRASQ